MTRHFTIPWMRLALQYECPTCGAAPGKPCIKYSRRFLEETHRYGYTERQERPTTEYVHSKRHWRAYAKYRAELAH